MVRIKCHAVLKKGILAVALVIAVFFFSSTLPAMAGDIPNLAPAYVNDMGQICSKGPEVNIPRTGKEPNPAKKQGPIKVGFTPTAMNTHYDIVIAGAKTAVDELGGKDVIDLVIQAPSSQSGTAEQMNIVETWVQQGYDAIGICSANDQAMTPIYKRARGYASNVDS